MIHTALSKSWKQNPTKQQLCGHLPLIFQKIDLFNKIKDEFFQVEAASIVIYACTTWTLTRNSEKKSLEGNNTRIIHTALSKSWKQNPTKQQLCGHLPHIFQNIKARWARYAGNSWECNDEIIRDILPRTTTHEQQNLTFTGSLWTLDPSWGFTKSDGRYRRMAKESQGN